MTRADDLTGFHFSLSEGLAVVRATVFYCVNLCPTAYDNDGDAVDLRGEGRRLQDGFTSADVDPL
jgi:hypothetical protein